MTEAATSPRLPLIARDDDKSVFVDALGIRYLLTAEETEGRVTVLEIPVPPKALVAPVHTHTLEDEYQMILEGTVGFELGGETIIAKAGDMITQPRGVPMGIWNASDEPGRLLVMFTPGGYDNYLKEVTPLVVAGDVPSMIPIWQRYGLQTDPSSIPRLVAAHGLERS